MNYNYYGYFYNIFKEAQILSLTNKILIKNSKYRYYITFKISIFVIYDFIFYYKLINTFKQFLLSLSSIFWIRLKIFHNFHELK